MSEKAGFGVIHSTSMERVQICAGWFPLPVFESRPLLSLYGPRGGGESLRPAHPWFLFQQERAASHSPSTSPHQQIKATSLEERAWHLQSVGPLRLETFTTLRPGDKYPLDPCPALDFSFVQGLSQPCRSL